MVEYNIEGRSQSTSQIPRLPSRLSVLFLGCNLDATEETYNTALPRVLPVIMKNIRA